MNIRLLILGRLKLLKNLYFLDSWIDKVKLQDFDTGNFIKSQRGNPQLMDTKGFIYNKTKLSRNIQNWECISRQKLKCHAKAQTSGIHIVNIKGGHNHSLPDPYERKETKKKILAIKK